MRPVNESSSPLTAPVRAGTLRGVPGFFRVGQEMSGRWTLFDPAGERFFCKAVHGVRRAEESPEGGWPVDSVSRLRAWGFNALGGDGDGAGRDDGLPYLATVDFIRCGALLSAPGLRLPDVFAADWAQLAEAHARTACAPLASEASLLGWITDRGLVWGQPPGGGRPTLLQLCLSLEPGFAAYHAAWEFVLASHRGRLDAVSRAWGVPLTNKEVVREMTRSETGIATRGFARDEARWTQEFARRYFATTAAAVRSADQNHLLFGCRLAGTALPAQNAAGAVVRAECRYPAVDVSMPGWHGLPSTEERAAQPVLADEVCWIEDVPARLPSPRRPPRLTRFERMLRRGRTALERMAQHPAVVGYAWTRWQDEPGEQPPFGRGLVHRDGAEATEHTEMLAAFNARVEALRP